MEIRRLRAGDYAVLASAIRRLIPEDERDGGVASDDHLKRALENTACYFIVCLIDSTPAAYLSAYSFPSVASDCSRVYLYDIVVDERHRRRGMGSRMVEELKRHCREDGAEHIWVGTSLENEAARKTFEGTGARRVRDTYVEYIYPIGEGRQQADEAGRPPAA